MGDSYYEKGEYDKALEMQQNALQIKLTTLGEQHPDTATTYNNIAIGYALKARSARRANKSSTRAKEWSRKSDEYRKMALEIYEKTLGPADANTIECRDWRI
eukprot:m.125401 g.125401  ORF g.125401 m.125401 type:complete len:102 (+) comp16319_c0_seq1:3-308(+)